MNISDALKAINTYPIPSNAIEVIAIANGLDIVDTYDANVASSDAFRLATADVYMYLYGAPSLREQEVSITVQDRDNYFKLANTIYGELGSAKFTGIKVGMIGENWNA